MCWYMFYICIFQDCVKPYRFNFRKFCKEQYTTFECLRRWLRWRIISERARNINRMNVRFYLIKGGCVLEQLIINVEMEEGYEMLTNNRYAHASILLDVPKASKRIYIHWLYENISCHQFVGYCIVWMI